MSFMTQRTQEQARRTAAPAVRLSFEQSEFDARIAKTRHVMPQKIEERARLLRHVDQATSSIYAAADVAAVAALVQPWPEVRR